MATYILLFTLTTEGREQMLEDAESLMRAEAGVSVPGVQLMGLYGVLGDYDFVSIVEAPDNDAVARFSLELGVRASAHITTLPAIPITRFAPAGSDEPVELEAGIVPPRPGGAPEREPGDGGPRRPGPPPTPDG